MRIALRFMPRARSACSLHCLPASRQQAVQRVRHPVGRAEGAQRPSNEPPPPPAVPGARARAESVAPADRSAADLPPTEALFDAINRGDIVTARDAISRGADLDGTNLLGLTPLELSVDLGRNDISFLLLSLRGSGAGSAGSRPPQGTEQAAAAPPTAADRRTRVGRSARASPGRPSCRVRLLRRQRRPGKAQRCSPATAGRRFRRPGSWGLIRTIKGG